MTKGTTSSALRRAGKRAAIHLVQAAIEGLKAVEAVIDELSAARDADRDDSTTVRRKIEVE